MFFKSLERALLGELTNVHLIDNCVVLELGGNQVGALGFCGATGKQDCDGSGQGKKFLH